MLIAGCGTVHYSQNEEGYAQPPADPGAEAQAPRDEAGPPRGFTPPPGVEMPPPAPPRVAMRYQAPPSPEGGSYSHESVTPPSTSSAPVYQEQIAPPTYRQPPPAVVEKPRERPGLATSWGETRVSPVHEVPFRRGSDSPFATGSLFYNDHGGVDAMASYDERMAARLDAPVPVHGGITFSVVDENGLPLPAMSLNGRIYVVGENGRRYSIIVTNLTDRRYEAVLSVDGLDVLDGKTASTRKRGYLIGPYASVTVDGFRKSYQEVAAFRFGSVGQSYAARTGSDRNVGVIGYAFFNERGFSPPADDEVALRRSADAFSGDRFAAPPEEE